MLNEYNFKSVYSTGEKSAEPVDFFNNALSRSIRFDLGLGFFSTASINVLSLGFARFIANGGRMRMYINQFLTEEDYATIVAKPSAIENSILEDFHAMLKILSERDAHFFNCISFLIQTKRIDIRIVIPKSGGIAHQKFGIFADTANNKMSFIGSLNLTASALMSKNLESIECQKSWAGGQGIIEEYEHLFESFFEGNKEQVTVLTANQLCKEIINSFPSVDEKQLIESEEELLKHWRQKTENSSTDSSSFALNQSDPAPRFPYPTGAFPYQIDAYKNWKANGETGIFAMATGTGKTITSLNCVLEEYKLSGKYKLVILVPSNDLVNQWVDEVGKFNYQNIYIVNGQNDWRKQLTELKNEAAWGIERNYVIISTYASFVDEGFQSLLKKLNDDSMVLIADEAHNVGSPTVRKAFQVLPIRRRIALSATPNRNYDEEGTRAIEELFHDEPPYCYSFTMERAIEEGRLMHYLYYPRIAYLDESEMQKYQHYTKRLLAHFDPVTKKLQNTQEVKDLLMARKRIIHKAKDKYRVFMNIVGEVVEQGKAKYCFVYTPEGVDYSDDDSRKIILKMKDLVYERYPDIRTNTFLGGDAGKKDKLRAFAEGKIDMLFAMKCLDEGVDVPRAEVGIFTSSTGNPRQFIQRRGRLLRRHKDKNYAYIYDTIVVPDYKHFLDKSAYEMERSLVRNELVRVAYFASLSDNYFEAREGLSDILSYYNLEIGSLIAELQTQ
jgi:superfamily II DNA or RNA helicase